MAEARSLNDLYVALLADTLSANEQMLDIVEELADIAEDEKLQAMLDKTAETLPEHNAKLEALLEKRGGAAHEEQCKGMEGIVKEAREHAIDLETDDPDVRDAMIVHAVQQMSHYGLAGYGTSAAMARQLGFTDDADALTSDLDRIYEADQYLTHLAESRLNRQAA